MTAIITMDGDVALVEVQATRFDAAEAPAFKADLAKGIDGGPRKVVLDLTRVAFMDSTALGALVSLLKMLGKDGSLAIAGAQPAVRRLFELTRLDAVFRLAETVPDARALVRG
ncbi:STAS domain-containing protein [Sphingomonadales bacterium 56]|jgi:anti-sigma B factor antagonist|uniref:STAS domain-containing protein n=1 Tax=Sphingomonadales TaxID=204457 RepID=UPI000BE484EC|nr:MULTISPECIES: STAS domain-containing protein [Sphingomonadaceae]MBY2929830.1 STAS domain-containing protein [Sphingomonadales bacterium 56]MBY2959987.1 STAS domain-containing protein [Sphingomonadales bacterium 58]CAD7340176.1 Putative anti-sigma factor antagonist [Sphingobium sp. S6]CAD7340248.1 Putative anti-sigma factor antagonist [Sphingobium sp. S8]